MFARTMLASAIAMTVGVWPMATLAESPEMESMEANPISKLSDWTDRKVKDQQGNSVGEVKDFAVNFKHGTITYAVVNLGGMFNSKNIAVPLSALHSSGGENKTLTLAATQSQWEAASTFDGADWPSSAAPMPEALAVGQVKPDAAIEQKAKMSDEDREFNALDQDGDDYIDRK